MVLIADSGSTKCDWILLDGERRTEYSTMGFNPFFHNEEIISNAVRENTELYSHSTAVKQVFIYSAGCSSEEMKRILKDGLQRCFRNAAVHVEHDTVGAAYATYSGTPGITCILGTGSNSCLFDGKDVSEVIPSLGYILGDEGSGSYFGKRVLTDLLYKKLPQPLHDDLVIEYGLTKEIIFEHVYRLPNANKYLASFMKVISKHKELEYVKHIIYQGLIHFIQLHVQCFPNYKDVPVHFIGSIAYYHHDILEIAAQSTDISIGTIIQKPIHGLVDYHINYVLDHSS